jgi:hypothetical protein
MSSNDRPGRHLDEEVDVARLVGFAAGHGPEDADVAGAVPSRRPNDGRPLQLEEIFCSHDSAPPLVYPRPSPAPEKV